MGSMPMNVLRKGVSSLIGCLMLLIGGGLGPPALGAGESSTASPTPAELRGEAYGHLMRSLFAAKRGELRSAGEEIQAAIKLQPDSPELHVQAAQMIYRLGRTADAEEHLRAIAARNNQEDENRRMAIEAESADLAKLKAELAARPVGPNFW